MQISESMDPHLLFSIMNTRLRNEDISLCVLCEHEGIDYNRLLKTMKKAGYTYDAHTNQFK